MIENELGGTPEGENHYQGHGYFQIILSFSTGYLLTGIALKIKHNYLAAEFHFGKLAFEKLPEIIELLSQNIINGILSTSQCNTDCPHKCRGHRMAKFDERIFPQIYLRPCIMVSTSCKIENPDDVESVKLLYYHIKKYTDKKR